MQHTMQQLTLRRWLRKHYLRIRAMHPYPYPQHVLQQVGVRAGRPGLQRGGGDGLRGGRIGQVVDVA